MNKSSRLALKIEDCWSAIDLNILISAVYKYLDKEASFNVKCTHDVTKRFKCVIAETLLKIYK